jgi:hypothetical protein
VTRSGRLLLSIIGAFAIATAGVAGAAAAPPKPSANPEAPAPALPWTVILRTNAGASAVLPGTSVTLTATANQDVLPTPYFIVIKDNTGTILHYCGSGTTCSAVVMYPTPTIRSFMAFIALSDGTSVQQISGDPLFVYWTAATYRAITPTRVLDTRNGTGLSGPSSSHVARTFQVTGAVVQANATAVTGNLTVTGQTSSGYLFLGPASNNDPTSSTLNFPVGDDRANGVTVGLSPTGTLSVTFVAPASGPTAHVIFDVTGYFVPDSGGATYVPLNPARILDTRSGTGLAGPSSSHAARTFQVTGKGGVPANAVAVTGNLTVTAQTGPGYLFLGPTAMNDPTSSTLNFPLGDDRANGVSVALSAGGTLSVTFVASGPGPIAHVIFDVTGYFVPNASAAKYQSVTPARILDTRNGTGLSTVLGPCSSHMSRVFAVTGHGGVPFNATAVTGNLTVTGQTSLGYLYLGPDGMNDPTSSTLNFPVADDRANGVTVALGEGSLSVTFVAPSPGPTTHVIFDVTGYFVP